MSYAPDTLRLLIAHASQDEAEQLMNALRNAGKATRAELALSEDDVIRALKSGSWDLLLATPVFGDTSLEKTIAHIQRLGKNLPVLALVDSYDEDTITDTLKAGASAVSPRNNRELLMLLVDQELDHVQVLRQLQKTEIKLHEAEKRLSVLMDQSNDAIAYVVDGMHVHANDAYVEMFGYESADDLAGMPIMDMVSAKDHEALKKLLRSRSQDENQTHELVCKGVNTCGEEFDATFIFSPSTYDGEKCTQIVIRTEGNNAALQQQLQEMSKIDQTTGLYNRGWFMDQLDHAVEQAVSGGESSAVLYIEIDNFENHQAAVGIDASDDLLRALADYLRTAMGENASLARVGGEDFAAIKVISDPEDARKLAEQMRAGIEKLMPEVANRTLQVTVSIGVAFASENSRNSEAVITRALRCCNKAQQSHDGKGNAIHVHDPMDDVSAGSSEAIALAVRKALDENGFSLRYQPILGLDGQVEPFYEVFVRLPQPKDEELEPAQFMAVAAEQGLSGKVDRWVVLNTIKALTAQSAPTRALINLDSHSFQDAELPAWIGKALKAAKLPGRQLWFQISEPDASTHLKQAAAFAKELAELGCMLSISRFGCALNPFKILDYIPARMLKFDGSFTDDLANPEGRAAFSKLIEQSRGRKCEVMVGFVESANQLQSIWTLGVDYLQGFYLQAPMESMSYDFTSDD